LRRAAFSRGKLVKKRVRPLNGTAKGKKEQTIRRRVLYRQRGWLTYGQVAKRGKTG